MTAAKDTATNPNSAAASLRAVMQDAQALAKGERNQQQGFSFRGVDAVMNLVGPLLRKHGAFIVPIVKDLDRTVSEQQSARGNTQYVTRVVVTVAYEWYGPDGTSISGVVVGEAFDYGDKAVTKAMSVAYRTYLLQTLCMPTNEPDPDTFIYDGGQQEHQQRPQERPQERPQQQAAPQARQWPHTAAEARTELAKTADRLGIPRARVAALYAERNGGTALPTATDVQTINHLTHQIETEGVSA